MADCLVSTSQYDCTHSALSLWLVNVIIANANERPDLEDPPLSLRSSVWELFRFPLNYDNGQSHVYKTKAPCRHCSAMIWYVSANMLINYLKRHHANVNITTTCKKKVYCNAWFKQPLAGSSDRAKAMTNAFAVFIAVDLRPYSVVGNRGFKNMMLIDPRY